MNKHGFPSVMEYKDGRGKPYYFRMQIDGRRYQTPSFVTPKEAADAGRALRRLISQMRRYPPCTCALTPRNSTHRKMEVVG